MATDFAIHAARPRFFVLELDLEPLAAAESFNDRAAEGKAPASLTLHINDFSIEQHACVTELAG